MKRAGRRPFTKRIARRGSLLLEVIAALTLLAIAGLSLLELALQSIRTVGAAHDRAKDMLLANRFLESVALWTTADLNRHLGRRQEGPFIMNVERLSPTVYHITLAFPDRAGGTEHALMSTSLYRESP